MRTTASTKRLRIAHVQPMTLDLFGHDDIDFGTKASYFLPNLARAQAAVGHGVVIHLMTSSRSHSLELEGIEVRFHRCLQPPALARPHRRFGRQLSLGMLRDIVSGKTNVVHFHGVRNCQLMFGAVVGRAARGGIPVIAHDQGNREGWAIEDRAFRYGLRRTAAFIAGNSESAELFRSRGIPEQRVYTIPNGYDPRVFFPECTERESDSCPLRILFVSRLTPEKDPLTAVEGIAIFAGSRRAIDVTLIGEGALRREVETRLASATDRLVTYDHVPQTDLAEHYRSADVLVLTSLGEGSNQTVVEAMACGLPVVATDVRGIRDVVDGAGILVPPGDSSAVASALTQVADKPTLLATLRQRGLDRVRSLTWATIVDEIDRVYSDVLDAGRDRG